MLVAEFLGASFTVEDDGTKVFHEISPVTVNVDLISGYYDHTIMTGGLKVRVMEDYDTIRRKIREAETWGR